MPPLLLLKLAWDHRDAVLLTLVLLLIGIIKNQHATITNLNGKPTVQFRDRVVEKRVVIKGAVKVVTVQAPDGTKTTTVDRAPETVTTDKDRDKERLEIPPHIEEATRKRYAGLGVDPARPRLWRARTGLNLGGAVDIGMAADLDTTARKIDRPMLELSYRF